MGISSRNPSLYIGLPSSYISVYLLGFKFVFPLVASIFYMWAVYRTCFRDRSIDRLCMKRVSEIGVLIGCVMKRVS